jgi:TolB-like protein
MVASVQSPAVRFCFHKFELDPASGELHQDGHRLPLPPKAFELLRALVEHPGEVVTREDLLAKLWAADTFVEFNDNLNHAVRKLREALGDSVDNPQFVETLPRYGYRFIASVKAVPVPEPFRTTTRIARRSSDLPILSLAVLPLSNLSGDPREDYFADGMTDALITELAKIHGLKVISRTSVMQFKDVKQPLPQIARALGADGILEGSVQRSDGRVRITVQLIRAPTDTHLWANSYERDAHDVLALQAEIAEVVTREIKLALTTG